MKSLEAFHRRQLRSIVGLTWPNHKVTNKYLYKRCNAEPLRKEIAKSRWRLFGHVLRLDEECPARTAMMWYFSDPSVPAFRGHPRVTLPYILNRDLKRATTNLKLENQQDLSKLTRLAADREAWSELCEQVFHVYTMDEWDTFCWVSCFIYLLLMFFVCFVCSLCPACWLLLIVLFFIFFFSTP